MKTAMILAAGFGTRMQPITLTRPKALVEIGGVTLLERNIRYLMSFGISKIVVNVHHFAEQIIDFVEKKDHFGIEILISDERDAILETGGGLLRAKPFLQEKEGFVLMNVDILTNLSLTQMIDYHKSKSNSLATLAVSKRNSSRQLLFDENMQLAGWKSDKESILVQKDNPNLSPFAFSGVHIISPTIFDHIAMQGKFSIITAYLEMAKTQALYGYNHTGDLLLDVGKPEAIAQAIAWFG